MSESRVSPHAGLSEGWILGRQWDTPSRLFRSIEVRDLERLRLWRNAQQNVLRQQRPLTAEEQRRWFREAVEPDYVAQSPSALLVVVEQEGQPIGYGGLTNIDWTSRRAELSFLAATERAADVELYESDLLEFLRWILDVAFEELELNRVFAETWAFRTAHIDALERAGMQLEGRMRHHVIKDGVVHDALLHGILRADSRPS